MQCTGAAKPGVFKWTITRRGPVIADVIRQGQQLASQSNIPREIESPPGTKLKIVAALFVGGLLLVVFLPALLTIADSTSAPDPAEAFQQLTGWQLPPDAEILNNNNTHVGMTNDGDYTLSVSMSPQSLQSLLTNDTHTWRDCPIDPEIVRSAWNLPDHSGKQYFAQKTDDSDSDWHRGHAVIIDPDAGSVWIYEWKT